MANVSFPIDARNRKAIREQLLLDTTGSGVESALFSAAQAAAGPEQKVFVSRTFSKAGRLSFWIVDDNPASTSAERSARRDALIAALGRVNP